MWWHAPGTLSALGVSLLIGSISVILKVGFAKRLGGVLSIWTLKVLRLLLFRT
jgi:hypothetical protein